MKKSIVHSVCIGRERGQLKNEIEEGFLIKNVGLEGDCHCGDWGRQVACLDWESVKASNENHSLNMGPGDFAENICIDNMKALDLQVGDRFMLGETAVLEVAGIGEPDHPGIVARTFGVSILPYEGYFCRVLKNGAVKKGDYVEKLRIDYEKSTQCF